MNAVTAMTSFTVKGGCSTCSRCEVRVDAVRLGLRFRDDLPALVAVGLLDQIHLVGDELFGRGARRERLPARHETERVDARYVGDRDARRTATELEQQAAVARRDPPGAECEVGTRLAGDVRHAVRVVHDRRTGMTGRLSRGSDRPA